MSSRSEPVKRRQFMADCTPADVFAVVVDFPAYPRLFPEIKSVKVLETEGPRRRVEFCAQVMVPARYVLDLVCDPETPKVDWTYVEGDVITNSEGSWRFAADGRGTSVEYAASLEVKAPLPGFVLRKITDMLVSASLPAMFASIAREVAARRTRGGAPNAQ